MELKEFNTPKQKKAVQSFSLEVDMKRDERRLRRKMAHDLQFNRDSQKRMPTVAKTFNKDFVELKSKMGKAKAMEVALKNASKAVQISSKKD